MGFWNVEFGEIDWKDYREYLRVIKSYLSSNLKIKKIVE